MRWFRWIVVVYSPILFKTAIICQTPGSIQSIQQLMISWPKLTFLLVYRPPVSRLPLCGGREVRVWCLSNHSHLSHQLRWSPVVIIDERDQAKLSMIELGKHRTKYSYWSGVTSSHYDSILAGEAPPSPMQYKLAEKLLLKKVNGGWGYGVDCCRQSKDGSGWCRKDAPPSPNATQPRENNTGQIWRWKCK